MASLTVIPDGPLGLPLDAIAGEALKEMRAAGRRPVELAKLATVAATEKREKKHRPPREEILLNLFKLAYLTALREEDATDLVVAVSPHQARFFRRVFLFEPLDGETTSRGGEGSLTVPMRLDLETALERHRERSARLPAEHELYRFFVNDREPEVLKWLRGKRRPLSAADVRGLFVER
ncbi:MAG: N-acyl amino acid synthase FeeM domain-containing protein, partial [Planctomycetota bacterium]